MTQMSGVMDSKLYEYMLSKGIRESALLTRLREETAKDPLARMQISPEQGQFMKLLVSIVQPQTILEIGTFTGYSSLCMAMASNDDCHITTCDNDESWTAIAKRYWQEAGVEQKVTLKLGEALSTLDSLANEGKSNSFDLIFLDADKENYPNYFIKLKALLKVGGLLLIDNVFWSGKVADSSDVSTATSGVRELNDALHKDKDFEISMIPISDGLTIAKKLV
ncbi:O-methyltransferase [Litoribrevibacter albus]|uniref:SAM-dependent methyltransferase n=1 Tax=Litoribrevibacter albus TaxID=1473156 RepID=A0AA37SC33_9GAMM|nr:O-methyltransferase [Litoribrevibacter albus]GLQ31881.1 hypothetical protein GCM10007876_23600 [Litoribrevibacter albus]